MSHNLKKVYESPAQTVVELETVNVICDSGMTVEGNAAMQSYVETTTQEW